MMPDPEPANFPTDIPQISGKLEQSTGGPSEGYLLTLLVAIYASGFVDRQIVNIVGEAIRRDLSLSNAELGLLTGFAFTLLYTVLALPAARLADLADRRIVLSGAVAIWSVLTAASGFAGSFVQLLATRVGVGIGEAGATAPSHAIIADRFDDRRRPRALAIHSLGVPLGTLIGLAMGGIVADAYGWRAAFIVAAIPGIVLAALAWFTLPRNQSRPHDLIPVERNPFRELRRYLLIPSMRYLALGAGGIAFVGAGPLTFYGPYFLAIWRQPLTDIGNLVGLGIQGSLGLVLGGAFGVGGLLGSMSGGLLADRWGIGNRPLLPAIAVLMAMVSVTVTFSTSHVWLALAALLCTGILTNSWFGPVYAVVQANAGSGRRATWSASLLFVVNMVGFGSGPLVIGLVADALRASAGLTQPQAVAAAAIASVLVVAPLAGWCFLKSRAANVVGSDR